MKIMSKKVNYYTKEGLERLQIELANLKTKGRADIARQIAEARDKGDLSENVEYDAAKDAQGHLEAKIAKLEDSMSYARSLTKIMWIRPRFLSCQKLLSRTARTALR